MASNFVSENGIKKIGEWVKGKINSLSSNIENTYLKKSDAANTYKKSSDLATVATSGSYNDLSNKPEIPSAIDISGKADITVNERVADIEETYSEYYYKITEDTVDENNYLNYYYLNNYEITSTSNLEEYDNSITYYEKINRISEAITEEDKKYYLEDGKYYDISSIQNYEYNDEITYYNIDLTTSSYNEGSIIIVKYNYNNRVIRTSDIDEIKDKISNIYGTKNYDSDLILQLQYEDNIESYKDLINIKNNILKRNIIINVITEYSLNYFTTSNYYENINIVNDIINLIKDNKNVFIKYGSQIWSVNYLKNQTTHSILVLNYIDNNYLELIENYPDKENNETDEEWKIKCNNFIIDNINITNKNLILIYNEEENITYIINK